MRQLEQILGPDELRDGLREYLTRFAFANATWTDLIEILDRRTAEDLAAWSRAWVDEAGRPTIATNLETANGKVSRLTFTQADPRGRSLRWNQQLQVALGYEHGARITTLKMDAPSVEVPRVGDLPLPNYVLANGEGTGYGLFALDDRSRQYFLQSSPRNRRWPDPRHRLGDVVGRHAGRARRTAAARRPCAAHAAAKSPTS